MLNGCTVLFTEKRKKMSSVLNDVLTDAIKVINFIQSRPLNHRLFQSFCRDSWSDHQQLLHTDVRWLSLGKTLQRLFELPNEVSDFFVGPDTHPCG